MTLKRFVVSEGHDINMDDIEWKYAADHSSISFYNPNLDRQIHVDGDYIGTEVGFICNGELSRFIGKVGDTDGNSKD